MLVNPDKKETFLFEYFLYHSLIIVFGAKTNKKKGYTYQHLFNGTKKKKKL